MQGAEMQVGLLVENHHDARAWLERSLNSAFPGIKLASKSTLAEGCFTLENLCRAGIVPDIAVIDLGLSDGCGITLIRKLTLKAPECISVVATRHENDTKIFTALKAGALGYLLKRQSQTELAQRLAGIAKGESDFSPAVVRRLLSESGPTIRFRSEPLDASGKATLARLTPREREILPLLSTGFTLAKIGDL
ncbi:MAG TPA: response regulator transcription factor, partial [Marinobacter sp.]|nr:response regulator transcription factor [Marinobacter sp.]